MPYYDKLLQQIIEIVKREMNKYWMEAYNLSSNSHLGISVPICESWSKMVKMIWQAKSHYDLLLPQWFDRLDIKNNNKSEVLISFYYDKEKKGYRPIQQANWLC